MDYVEANEANLDESVDLVDQALDFLAELMGAMDVAADISVTSEDDEQVVVTIETDEDAGVLIGRKGQTLQSIQYLMNVIYGVQIDKRFQVDVGDYRQRHAEKLQETAHEAAKRVQETGRRFQLEPMPPADRWAVHNLVSEAYPDLQTYSTGEEPNRRIVIEPKGATGPRPGELGRYGGRGGRGGRGGGELKNFDARRGGEYKSRRPR